MPLTVSRKNAAIVLRALELDDLFEHRERFGRGIPSARHPVVRIENVHDAGHAGLGAPAPRIAGQCHRAMRAAVVRAVAREDLVPAGVRARDFDRVLVGVGAAVGEEEDVDIAGRELGELRAQPPAHLRRHERVRIRHRRGLLLDRRDDAFVAVPGVDAHQLTVEVEVALAVRGPEVDALRARHRNRVDRSLRRPFEQRVLAAEVDDLGVRQRGVGRGRRQIGSLSGSASALATYREWGVGAVAGRVSPGAGRLQSVWGARFSTSQPYTSRP